MHASKFQEEAARTINMEQSDKDNLINFAMGMMAEAGEVTDLIKKLLFYSHDGELIDEKLEIEIGDVLWYLTSIATIRGLSLDTIMHKNIRKIERRYPNGYTAEGSRNREDVWHD